VRARKWLTAEQQRLLRDAEQEFTLLLDENGDFELVPCDPVEGVAQGSREVAAFTFERENGFYAVYWHRSADRELELPMSPARLVLLESLGKETPVAAGTPSGTTILPVGKRRYLRTSKSDRDKLLAALRDARLLN